MFGSNYFNKNSILRIEKGPFYFKFCILFNFQDPRFPLISRHIYVVPPSKCSIILIRRAYSVKDFFPVFWTFFLHDLKVYAYYFKYCTLLSVKSRTIRLSESRNIYIYNITHASYANPAELILSLVLTVYVINWAEQGSFRVYKSSFQPRAPPAAAHVNNNLYRY